MVCRGYLCLLHIKFCLLVGETCGLPRANTVRPYRALGKLPYETQPFRRGFDVICFPSFLFPVLLFGAHV